VQYTTIRYTQRLEDAGAVPSVGSKGDSLFTGYYGQPVTSGEVEH
jgi:hypothetical protein